MPVLEHIDGPEVAVDGQTTADPVLEAAPIAVDVDDVLVQLVSRERAAAGASVPWRARSRGTGRQSRWVANDLPHLAGGSSVRTAAPPSG